CSRAPQYCRSTYCSSYQYYFDYW
nr:immunoglobulin heavy chain junction region [Macaca mulatta]MOV56748.1 immunoglobulin heavy chain junction region [Macaca mulatta]MOV56810.1 immunoglobulin heavy chain junction region [Macaca mulatta]MOV56823.1 immunoglobulin heavy chain junction region [Macaca mulatta]MOV59245.1 immunoglobulin heavy chain junction region [Macaca mulatta]